MDISYLWRWTHFLSQGNTVASRKHNTVSHISFPGKPSWKQNVPKRKSHHKTLTSSAVGACASQKFHFCIFFSSFLFFFFFVFLTVNRSFSRIAPAGEFIWIIRNLILQLHLFYIYIKSTAVGWTKNKLPVNTEKSDNSEKYLNWKHLYN